MGRLRLACAATLSLTAAACASAPAAVDADGPAYANFLVGRVADMLDDHQAASDRLVGAAQNSQTDAAILEGAISSSLSAGEIGRARSVAAIAARRGVHLPYADLLLGADALSAGRWTQARMHFAAVREGLDQQLAARALIAWAGAGAGRGVQEAQAISALSLTEPYTAVFAYQRAMTLDLAGQDQAARTAYGEANAHGVWLPPALERQADFLARSGARDAALDLLDPAQGAGVNPAISAARARLAAGQSVSGAPLNPARGAAISLYGLASIYLHDGAYGDGLATLSLALALDPQLDAARIAFAQAQTDLEHPVAARAALAPIPQTSPYRVTANSMLAWLAYGEGNKEEAIATAQANAQGGSVLAVRALADLYRANETYSAAEPLYTRVIEAQPADARDWRLYFARGAVRERLGQLQASEADMRQALVLAPEQSDVLNYLGYTLIDRTDRIDEGIALIERAAALRPASGAIVDSLGWAYFRQGDYPHALDLLERAVELDPGDPTLNDHLGDVYWRVGRRTEARYQWRRALTFNAAVSDRAAIEMKLSNGLTASVQPVAQNR